MSIWATEVAVGVWLAPIRLMLGQVVLAVDHRSPVSFVEDVNLNGPVTKAVVD